jgi:DNA-binding NarL/FixJ family response regulator
MKAKRKAPVPLTAQERKVLKLVAEAKTNKEIAAALGISPSTVKRHLENILKKLQLKNRVEAAVFAVRMGDCPPHITEAKEAA